MPLNISRIGSLLPLAEAWLDVAGEISPHDQVHDLMGSECLGVNIVLKVVCLSIDVMKFSDRAMQGRKAHSSRLQTIRVGEVTMAKLEGDAHIA